MTKITTTHLLLPGQMAPLHVIGKRQEVIDLITEGYNLPVLYVDLPMVAQKKPNGPFLRTKVALSKASLEQSIIMGEHELEVSDEPYGNEVEQPGTNFLNDDEGLEVQI